MTPEEIAHIKRIPLFREIDDAVIRGVAEVGVSRDLALGEAIFRSGDPGTELYIILAGAVRIHTMEDGHELELAVLREGNYFGEMSVIDGSPRSADATVAEAGTLFVVKSTEYLALLSRFEPLLKDLLLRLSGNIRQSNVHRFGLVREKDTLREEAELDRLRSLSQMVAGVAHEINTPIGIVQNAASLVTELITSNTIPTLAKDADAAETLRDVVEACALVQKNIAVAARLVQSFKNLSVRQLADVRERVDILAVVEEALGLYRLKAKTANLELSARSELPPSERAWEGFPANLTQVVLNLVTNADRYAYPKGRGGKIEVTVSAVEVKRGVPGFEVVVRDFGEGIAKENLPQIFDPFFTTARGAGGTGLGLAIVKNIVTASLGGTVRVESAPGTGTSFFIRVPRAAPAGGH
jgi:signal transduction histidine kinase